MQAQVYATGEMIDYTPGTAKVTGEVVVQNGLPGVVVAPIAANELGALKVQGEMKIAKATGAISAGNAVYWDADGNPVGGTAGSGAATTTSSGNTLLGYATLARLSADTHAYVNLNRQASVTIGGLPNAITDPGDAGAIPVTASGYCPIVTAGSETRTLAAPSFIGQQLLLYIKTDGGTCVITVASAINQTGNNTITMADVRDTINLVAVESGSNKVWHVVSNDGAALSTV